MGSLLAALWLLLLLQQTYTDKLNVALRTLRDGPNKELAKLGIDKLLTRLDEVPVALRADIKNNVSCLQRALSRCS